jgi:hypothetical protein
MDPSTGISTYLQVYWSITKSAFRIRLGDSSRISCRLEATYCRLSPHILYTNVSINHWEEPCAGFSQIPIIVEVLKFKNTFCSVSEHSVPNCCAGSQMWYFLYQVWIFFFVVIHPSIFCDIVDLGGLVVSVLATGPKVRGFDPDRGRWIFKGDKNPEHNFLRRGSKAVSPMS